MIRAYNRLLFLSLLLMSLVIRSSQSDEIQPPVFSHHGGQYTTPFELSLAAENDATVHYTTDGSVPVDTSAVYTEPIPVDQTVVIRARVYRQNGAAGPVASHVYTRLDEEVQSFHSDLPLVIVHQFDVPIIPSERTPAYITFIDHNNGERTWLAGDTDLQSRMQTNIRGSSSQQFPKKQYAVRLVDDDEENRNEPVLGLPSENNWILHAPYDDKTLMRNAVAYRLSRDIGWYAPRTKFVELFLHEGEGPLTEDHYHGVYMLTERIKWDNNRVDIEKLTPDDNAEPEIRGGYIIQNDRDVHITTARGSNFACVRPQDWDITDEQREWITQYIDEFEAALFGADFTDPDVGYHAFINVDSFIDHHLITELSKEIDGYRLSTFMYKERDGKLTMGPLWDFNLSFGNANYNRGWDPEGWYYDVISQTQYLYGWYTRLFEDPEFEQRYTDRWWELRQSVFSDTYIIDMINEYAVLLDESQERNFERWPILGTYVWPNPSGYQNRDTYEKEVEWMIDWVENRLEWIDSQMGDTEVTELLHYWYLNIDLANDTPFEYLGSTYNTIDGSIIEYQSSLSGYPFYPGHDNWRKASMERRNSPTPLNYRPDGNNGALYDEDDMRGLQVRQPFTGDGGENTMIFHLPTNGYENIIFAFAAKDEGAAEALLIDYSVIHGDNEWITNGLSDSTLSLDDEYRLYAIDLSEIEEANSNPGFRIRMRFDGEDMAADEGNRVTFNNISLGGTAIATGVPDPPDLIADEYRLEQNFPNPFNPATTIRFSLPERSRVTLTVFNILGQTVSVPVDENIEAGNHEIIFDASHLPSGMYIYRLHAGDYVDSKTMMLVQ